MIDDWQDIYCMAILYTLHYLSCHDVCEVQSSHDGNSEPKKMLPSLKEDCTYGIGIHRFRGKMERLQISSMEV